MAVTAQHELIWKGRLHLGDEPGIYGDSAYCGLAAELPISISRSDPTDQSATSFKLLLETEELQTFVGYLGHAIDVILYLPDPNQPFHSIEQLLAQARFVGTDNNRKEVVVTVGNATGPFRLSVRFRCDTTVNPGFYDDFVWRRLKLIADNFSFFASFGFPS